MNHSLVSVIQELEYMEGEDQFQFGGWGEGQQKLPSHGI